MSDQTITDKEHNDDDELIAYLLEQEQAERAQSFAIRPRAGGSEAPLSYGQQRLWFLDQMEPGNPAYHLSLRQWFTEGVDRSALNAALNEILRRHESLRTNFGFDGGDTVQRVNEPADLLLVDVDATDVTSVDELESRLGELMREPFDLELGPLVHSWLIQTGEKAWLLYIVVHHIAGDRVSMMQFSGELHTLYHAFLAGKPSPLDPLPIQYADYAIWERASQREDLHRRDLDYWRDRLANLSTLELPTDYPRPPSLSFEGGEVTTLVAPDLLQQIDDLAQRSGVTRFMVLVAALAVLLNRLSGQQDIALGTPISNRNLPELEQLIGHFINTLVLRVDVSGNPTVNELLGRVRETSLGAYTHQEIPFEKLVDEIKPERDLSRNPLFQVMIVQLGREARTASAAKAGQDHRQPQAGTAGSAPRMHPAQLSETTKTTVDCDLEVYLNEQPEGANLAFCFKKDLFEAETVQAMLEQFVRLLNSMTTDPQRRVGELSLLDASERDLALGLHGPVRQAQDFQPVHRLFEQSAQRVSQSVAVVARDAELTYDQLDQRSNQLARELIARGLGAEDLVGICLPSSCDLLVAVLAVFKAGCAYVPLDPEFPSARLEYMVADAGLNLILTRDGVSDVIPGDISRLDLDQQADRLACHDGAALDTPIAASQLAYVIYTSGSTGQPKGVRIEHAALANFVLGLSERIGFTADDHLLAIASLSFDVSLLDLFVPVLSGASVILVDHDTARDGIALAALLQSSAARVMHATPATWQLLVSSGWSGDRQLRALSGGEALPRALAEHLRNHCAELWNLYGPTETTIYSMVADLGKPSSRQFVDIGTPISETQIYVLDSALQPLPAGVVGELCIAGAGLARDYLGLPELSAQRFVRDPFSPLAEARLYRSGDLARLHRDGSIEYLGRSDHQVKLRGYRIELGEVESAIADLDRVRQAVVLCREDVAGDPRLVAYVVTDSAETFDPDRARALLRDRLPGYMIPSAFISLEEMPLTPSAKVDRQALPLPPTEVRVHVEHLRAPETASELALAEVWRELLDVDQVGLQENFFDLGGHSLLAVKAIFEMKRRTGIVISPAEYMMQNLGQIAVHYDQAPAESEPPRRLFGFGRRRSR